MKWVRFLPAWRPPAHIQGSCSLGEQCRTRISGKGFQRELVFTCFVVVPLVVLAFDDVVEAAREVKRHCHLGHLLQVDGQAWFVLVNLVVDHVLVEGQGMGGAEVHAVGLG